MPKAAVQTAVTCVHQMLDTGVAHSHAKATKCLEKQSCRLLGRFAHRSCSKVAQHTGSDATHKFVSHVQTTVPASQTAIICLPRATRSS
jgi:hypothetical protein